MNHLVWETARILIISIPSLTALQLLTNNNNVTNNNFTASLQFVYIVLTSTKYFLKYILKYKNKLEL